MHKFIQYFFLSVCLLFELNSQAQIINTLDPNFKEMLLYSNIDNSIAKDSLNNDIKIDINNNSEIEISEALRVFSLDVPSSIITSLEGIALFTNLRYLSCDLNPIDTLDVRSLSNLVTLNCSNGNLLRSLNVNGLSNLAELNCYGNLLSSLELNGLSNLKILGCSNNQLNSLDVSGLSSLERLYCSNNQLNSLEVSILSNLISLECSENPLGSIDVSNLTSLEFLGCIYNQLSSLDVSNLSSLEILACSYNQLSSLDVNRLIKIKYLYCSDNKLNSLNVNALNNLVNLDCAGNQLKSLNISGLSNLVTLNCTNNQLYSLTISGLLNLDDLRCGGNQLISIYMNNGNIFPLNYFFSPNPNLRYICVDGLMVNSINNRLFLEGINNVTVNPFCSTTLNGTHYSLNGNAIYDANSDGCTSSDSNFPYLQLKKKNALDSSYSIADNQGNFSMTLDSGTYTLTPLMPNNYYNCTPLSTTVTFPEDTIPQQFCITPNGTHHDVSVT
jgi:Leucine-rich repeat (LRR) protein